MKQMISVTIKMPKTLKDNIDKHASYLGVTSSEIIRAYSYNGINMYHELSPGDIDLEKRDIRLSDIKAKL